MIKQPLFVAKSEQQETTTLSLTYHKRDTTKA